MNNQFEDSDNIDFMKKLLESESKKFTLPESLKSENLCQKYEKEIKNIKDGTAEEASNVIPIRRKNHYAAAAACIAFACAVFFAGGYHENILQSDNASSDKIVVAEAPEAYSFEEKETLEEEGQLLKSTPPPDSKTDYYQSQGKLSEKAPSNGIVAKNETDSDLPGYNLSQSGFRNAIPAGDNSENPCTGSEL